MKKCRSKNTTFMVSNIFAVLFASNLFSSCSHQSWRTPSSIDNIEDNAILQNVLNLKQKKIELYAKSVHFENKNQGQKSLELKKEIDVIDQEIAKLEKNIHHLNSHSTFQHNSKNWRKESETIELNYLDLYLPKNNVEFNISTFEAQEINLKLSHNIFTNLKYTKFSGTKEDLPRLDFEMKCQAPFKIDYGLYLKNIKANETLSFSLGDKKLENDTRKFIFDNKMSECSLVFTLSNDDSGKEYQFKLVSENKKLNNLLSLISTTETCTTLKAADDLIESNEFTNITCPLPYKNIQILPEPEDSLHARVKMLLGQDLPDDFIKNGNPYAKLDFSKAPKLDAILVSYLVFRADFYGTLLARLLAYHADQGSFVRIIVSEVISLDKDKAMYEKLMAKHPNLKFIRYEFDRSQKGGAKFSELHRTNHIKLFITYSKDNKNDSNVIVGGRNIHDGFVFKKPIDVSKYPEIVNYVSGDESWAYWRDFEMVIKGQNFTESVVRHFMSFYHINKENLIMKPTSIIIPEENNKPVSPKSMRHYISIPFKDGPNLNQFYARLIDQSKKKILISSPYFRPVKEISDALDRASKRGVDITIITRLDLEGDTADFILGAVNKDGVNKFIEKVKVYEYTESKVILHSKLLMIDDETSFISSVNLNKRSFYHDLENGVLIKDADFNLEMSEVYSEYLKISTQITEEQKFIFWKKWFIKIFDKVF